MRGGFLKDLENVATLRYRYLVLLFGCLLSLEFLVHDRKTKRATPAIHATDSSIPVATPTCNDCLAVTPLLIYPLMKPVTVPPVQSLMAVAFLPDRSTPA